MLNQRGDQPNPIIHAHSEPRNQYGARKNLGGRGYTAIRQADNTNVKKADTYFKSLLENRKIYHLPAQHPCTATDNRVKDKLSYEDWQYRQAEKNAHNEILASIIMVIGVNLLVGGLIITVFTTGQPIIIPFITQQFINLPIALAIILTNSGFAITLAGFALSIHYDKKRSWHLKEIDKSGGHKNWQVAVKTANEMLQQIEEKKKKN
jgi:hypothetical protein